MKLTKKLTVLLLVLAMALSCLPMAAFATELEEPNQTERVSAETIPEEVVAEESALSPEETEPVIVETEPATETAEPVVEETKSVIDETNPVIEETEPVVMETLSAVQDEAMNAEEGNTESTIVNSGVCGENLTWTLDSEGVLVISGKGAMKNYTESSPAPWYGMKINHVLIESGTTTIGNYAFYKAHADTFSIPTTVTTIGTAAMAYNDMVELIIPEGVSKIGSEAFSDCALVHIYLPSTLKTIGSKAFARCAFQAIEIPDSVTSIGERAFYSCSKLEIIYISRSVKTIKERTFQYCANLDIVILPGSVTSIEDWAFSDCSSLSTVYYLGTEAQFKNLSIGSGNRYLESANWYLASMAVKHPKNVTTAAGKTVKFSTASSRSNCTFQWYYLAPDSEEWQVCSGSSAKTATYSFTAKASMDGYWFCCVITDEYGSEFSCNSALLTIVPAPKITKQPEDAMVKSGQTITATVEAEGENLTYTWYYAKKGSSTYTKSSITTNTYSTTMDSSRNGRKVYCVVKDAYGQSVKSATATLWLETTPLVITQQPESITVKNGEKAAVTVEASGDGLTYKWYYAKAGSSSFSKSSTTGKTYSTTMNTDRDGRQVYCVVTDQYGKTAKTETVTLNMKKTPLKLISAPESVTVKNGKTATVTVEAEGDGLTYAWYYAKAGSSSFTKSSTTKKTYSTTMNTDRDGRQLYCIVKDAYGQKIKTDVVSIHMEKTPLKLVSAPEDVTVKNGKTATVTVEAEGDGLTYTWYYAKAGSTTFTKSSTTKKTYSTTMNADRDGRQLYCIVKDTYGQKIKTDVVSIHMEKTPLKLVSAPESVTVKNGKTATVTVEAEGDGLTYTWYYAKAGSTKFTKSSTTKKTYSTTMNADRDGRQLYCIVKDAYGQKIKTDVVSIHMG